VAPGICGNQQAADLALDLVVAPFADPALHQPSLIVEEVLRRPSVVTERAPDGEVVVDGDGIRQSVVADSPVDIAGVLAELKLRRVHADDDQPERRVSAIPLLHVRGRPNPIDARVLPEIHDHDLPA